MGELGDILLYARYIAVGIALGEGKIMNRLETEEVLKKPYMPFYVYLLRNPKGHVFYVGKGEGKRILNHEKELYRKHFPVHTNWKKLNRVAQIIASGKEIGYEIESWHYDEVSAYEREDKLILKYERKNPYRLCNSNGQRWRGKPSKALIKLRAEKKIGI